MLPPGRAMLTTKPLPTGSSIVGITMGIVFVAFWVANPAAVFAATMTSTLRRTTSSANSGKSFRRAMAPAPLDCNVAAFDVAEVAKSFYE